MAFRKIICKHFYTHKTMLENENLSERFWSCMRLDGNSSPYYTDARTSETGMWIIW